MALSANLKKDMEIIKVSQSIEAKILELEMMRPEIKNRAEAKSKAISNYDKALAVTIIKLRNGVAMKLDGEIITSPPATVMEKIAKGICFNERLELERADSFYKSLISNIECLKSELNGLQSINRYLDNMQG